MSEQAAKLFAIAAIVMTVYIGSYLHLSRRGFAAAEADNRVAFYFIEPRRATWWRPGHEILTTIYWPLVQIDIAFGTGRPVAD